MTKAHSNPHRRSPRGCLSSQPSHPPLGPAPCPDSDPMMPPTLLRLERHPSKAVLIAHGPDADREFAYEILKLYGRGSREDGMDHRNQPFALSTAHKRQTNVSKTGKSSHARHICKLSAITQNAILANNQRKSTKPVNTETNNSTKSLQIQPNGDDTKARRIATFTINNKSWYRKNANDAIS